MFLMVLPLKWACMPYLLQTFLMLLHRPWVYGMTMQPFTLPSVVADLSPAVSWLFSLFPLHCYDLWTFFPILPMAHLGYLQWLSIFLRWSISFWRSCSLLHTVLALWVRVLITLYWADKWWWLADCRYWSLWVGFLYTEIDRLLSGSGLTIVSRKGMTPSSFLSLTLNVMAGSTLLNVF